MKYVVYGAGAVGGVIGANLHRAGIEVSLVARGEHLAALRSRGCASTRRTGPSGCASPPSPAPPRWSGLTTRSSC